MNIDFEKFPAGKHKNSFGKSRGFGVKKNHARAANAQFKAGEHEKASNTFSKIKSRVALRSKTKTDKLDSERETISSRFSKLVNEGSRRRERQAQAGLKKAEKGLKKNSRDPTRREDIDTGLSITDKSTQLRRARLSAIKSKRVGDKKAELQKSVKARSKNIAPRPGSTIARAQASQNSSKQTISSNFAKLIAEAGLQKRNRVIGVRRKELAKASGEEVSARFNQTGEADAQTKASNAKHSFRMAKKAFQRKEAEGAARKARRTK